MKVFAKSQDQHHKPIKAWVDGVELADNALDQLKNIASLPFIHSHVAVMPDVHLGKGATIGSVIATEGAIIPAAVGVDIGCGMMAVRTNLVASDLPDNLFGIRSAIEEAVPHGRSHDGGNDDKGAWREYPPGLLTVAQYNGISTQDDDLSRLAGKYQKLAGLIKNRRWLRQLGTLGGGNHFIELCVDDQQDVWVMLHSGSRGTGSAIGQLFINLAKEEMRRWFINLPDQDLAYLSEGSQYFKDYCHAIHVAQNYAFLNRSMMMHATLRAIAGVLKRPIEGSDQAVNCHHNYVSKERHFGKNVWVTRKGALRAGEGELGIIPGSMGAKSFIVCGKGHRESFCSCSHGAGRRMGRREAERTISVETHYEALEGIECRKDSTTLDETPSAYKDIDAVMAAQSDMVDVVRTLKQVVCVKG